MVRTLGLALLLGLSAAAAPAAAQGPQDTVPPPPGSYEVAVLMDDVLSPLVVAAEADAAEGRHALAVARAELVLAHVASTSTLRVRAEGVRLVATQGLDATAATELPPETVLEPLVASAQAEAQRGRHALAIARLDFVLARVPASSPLATRATSLRQASMRMLAASAMPQPAPPAYGQPPPQPIVTPSPPYAGYRGAARGAAEIPPPAEPTPSDPTRRGDGEVLELAITAMSLGSYVGFWIPFAAGLSPGGERDPAYLVYTLTILAGGGFFGLGVAGLDSGSGLRTGVGPTISVGIRYGIGMGFLMWGAFDSEFDPLSGTTIGCPSMCMEVRGRSGWTQRTAMPMAFGLGGALIGAILGYGLEPSTNDVRLVEAAGIWGTIIGAMLSIAAAQNAQQGFAITGAGLGLGILGGAMAATAVDFSPRRSWLVTTGVAAGAGAGQLINLIITASTRSYIYPVAGTLSAVLGLGGMIFVALVTDNQDERPAAAATRARADAERVLDSVRLSVSPTEGGIVGQLSGQF